VEGASLAYLATFVETTVVLVRWHFPSFTKPCTLIKLETKRGKQKKEKQKGIIEGNLRKQVNEMTWCSPTGSEEHHKGSCFGDKNGESGDT